MLLSPIAVSNVIIKKAKDDNITDLTPMKLQKLLYFISGRYIVENKGEPLFAENFVAWQHGPVLTSVYYEFSAYRGSQICNYATDAKGIAYAPLSDDPRNKLFFDVFNKQWCKYRHWTPTELSEKTHEKGSPWGNTLCNKAIRYDDIEKYFNEHSEL